MSPGPRRGGGGGLRAHPGGCGEAGDQPVRRAESSSPFLDAEERAEQPDHDRDVLVEHARGRTRRRSARSWGAVGYHYEQWAQVSAYAQGIGVRTRDNPDFTMLDDETLEPRWSVAGGRRSGRRTTPARSATWSRRCPRTRRPTSWPSTPTPASGVVRRARAGAGAGWWTPSPPQLLEDEDVAVLDRGHGRAGAPGPARRRGTARWLAADARRRLRRLPRRHGRRDAARGRADPVPALRPGVGRGEATGALCAGLGRDGYDDLDAAASRPVSTCTCWAPTRRPRTAVVLEWTAAREVGAAARDRRATATRSGTSYRRRGGDFDAALRAGRVLVRAGDRWSAYDIEDGRPALAAHRARADRSSCPTASSSTACPCSTTTTC